MTLSSRISNMVACECGANFTRKSNLLRHKRETCWKHIGLKQDIPTFDGSESKSKKTMDNIERMARSRDRSPIEKKRAIHSVLGQCEHRTKLDQMIPPITSKYTKLPDKNLKKVIQSKPEVKHDQVISKDTTLPDEDKPKRMYCPGGPAILKYIKPKSFEELWREENENRDSTDEEDEVEISK